MELQFEKKPCSCLNRVVREVKTEEVSQEVRLSDGMPDIGRVLATWGQVVIRSKEWRGDTVTVSGGIMVWILYAPEDGTDPRTVDSWIPFAVKWDVSAADREGTIRALPLLRCADSRALSARKLMVRAGVAILGEMLCGAQLQLSQPAEMPEDVELLKHTYPLWLPVEAGEKAFQLDEELTVPGATPGVDKILSFTLRPEITEEKVTVGRLVFRGSCNLHLVYRCIEGRLRSCEFEVPFSQFQDLEDGNNEVKLDLTLAVTNLELEPGEEGRLRLKCGLVCQYLIHRCVMAELVQDAYSPRRSVELTEESLNQPGLLEQRQEKITAQVTLPGRIGQIVDVTFLPDFPHQRRTGEGIELDLPGTFQVLYQSEDGSIQSASARWEGKSNLPAGEGSCVGVTVCPVSQSNGTCDGDSMELRGQLQLMMTTTSDRGIPMVSALELGELKAPDPARPSLILCRCDGESLWSLAKSCGSTLEGIRSANGIEEADRGTLVLIPVS